MAKDKRVVCIVQARMGSSRLPGKVMKPVLGVPMISYTLKRLEKCSAVDEVVLATSVLPEDGVLADYAGRQGFSVFRGSEENVLERYVQANRQYGGDIVIRVTGDCPLIDPGAVDTAVNAFLNTQTDYLSIRSMRGFDTEVFSAEALERTYATVSALSDFKNYKEHVTIYMYRHPDEFTITRIPVGESRQYRLCVDEIDDFRVIEAIFNHFKNPYPAMDEIIVFLDEHPEIAGLNSHVQQKKA